jgi:hypothetical protein
LQVAPVIRVGDALSVSFGQRPVSIGPMLSGVSTLCEEVLDPRS